MMQLGQSRKETQKPTASIVNPKLETRIGNWNLRTMFEIGKAAGLDNVVAELLKTYLQEITKELAKLFNKVKGEGVAPKSWNRGLISKVTQEG